MYRYDALGHRVLQNAAAGNILSQYAQDGQLMQITNVRSGFSSSYISLSGSLVAVRKKALSGGAATVEYQHTDALGTPVAVTNASRAVIERSEYEPYGQVLNRLQHDGPGFTGHVQDALTGLTYMQQRYYDPMVGRFLSVDPVTAYEKPGVNFNRYVYASDNPYKFTDPDGRQQYPTTFVMPQGFPVNVKDMPAYESSKTVPGATNHQIASRLDEVSTFATTVALATTADVPLVAFVAEAVSATAAVGAALTEPSKERFVNVATIGAAGVAKAVAEAAHAENAVAAINTVEAVQNAKELNSMATEAQATGDPESANQLQQQTQSDANLPKETK